MQVSEKHAIKSVEEISTRRKPSYRKTGGTARSANIAASHKTNATHTNRRTKKTERYRKAHTNRSTAKTERTQPVATQDRVATHKPPHRTQTVAP